MPSMQPSRRELKFLVGDAIARALEDQLAARLSPDPHAGEDGRYTVATVYFDTPDRDAFWAQVRRFPTRRKIRARCYPRGRVGVPPACFLEIKYRVEGRTAKRRMTMSPDEALAVAAGSASVTATTGVERALLAEVAALRDRSGLEPACVMRYERAAWAGTGAEAGLRVTLDSDVRYRLGDPALRERDSRFEGSILPAGHHVLEVKVADRLPRWLSELLGRTGCTPQGFSKYGQALLAAGLARHPATSRLRRAGSARRGAPERDVATR